MSQAVTVGSLSATDSVRGGLIVRFLPMLRSSGTRTLAINGHEITSTAVSRASQVPFGLRLGGGQPYRTSWSTDRATNEGYARVVWVFRAINVIAGSASRLRIGVRDGDPDDGPWTPDLRLQRLFNRAPNRWESARFFRYRVSAQLLLSKAGVFIEVILGSDGLPTRLHLLPPDRCAPVPDPYDYISGFRVTRGDGGYDTLPQYNPAAPVTNSVIWIRLPHPTDPYLSGTPMESAGLDIDTQFFAKLYNRNFMQADGRPGGILTAKDHLSPNDANTLRERFGGGVAGAGRVTVLESPELTWLDTAMSPRDAQYVNSMNLSKTAILAAFGVPESIAGDSSARCVDMTTEALTQRGWVSGGDLSTDDTILSMDPADGVLKWSPVREVYRAHYAGDMYRLRHSHIDALVTPGHNWAVHTTAADRRRGLVGDYSLRAVENVRADDRIRVTGDAERSVTDPAFTSAFVEAVGWAVTEGYFAPNDQTRAAHPGHVAPYVRIRQNVGPNNERIERTLKECGASYSVHVADGRALFNLRGEVAAAIQQVAPDKVMSMGFLLALSASQRELLFQTMVDADGCRQKTTRSLTFAQKDPAAAEAFAILATLAGYRTSIREETHPYTHRGVTRPTTRHLVIVGSRKTVTIQRGTRTVEPFDGQVWCPRTDYGTFVARRGGRVFVTGNTFDNADQEEENFWRVTMLDHLSTLESGFDQLTPGGWDDNSYVRHDLDSISVLQRDQRMKYDRLAADLEGGRISLDYYLSETGREPLNIPSSRTVWRPPGMVPIGNAEDMKSVLLTAKSIAPVAPPAGADPGAAPGQPPALPQSPPGLQGFPHVLSAPGPLAALAMTPPGARLQNGDPNDPNNRNRQDEQDNGENDGGDQAGQSQFKSVEEIAALMGATGLTYAAADRALAAMRESKALSHRARRLSGSAAATTTAPATPDHTDSIMVCLKPADPVAASLALAVPDATPPGELHVTLAYLGETSAYKDSGEDTLLAAVTKAVAGAPAVFTGEVSGTGMFKAADDDAARPFVALVDIPGLSDFQTQLSTAIDAAGLEVSRNHGFTPHMTLAYVGAEDTAPTDDGVAGTPLRFRSLWVVYGTHWTEIPLRGGASLRAVA